MDSKAIQITAVSKLLETLVVSGYFVILNAMGLQKVIGKEKTAKGGI